METSPTPPTGKRARSSDGVVLRFNEYLRLTLATEKIDPVQEFEQSLDELCDDFKERIKAIDVAVRAKMHDKPHPGVLPKNLFSSEGDWETYATPSRDTRLRTSFLELRSNLSRRYDQWLAGDFTEIKDPGSDFRGELVAAFHRVNFRCEITYLNSANKRIPLSFELAIRRLFRLSFDPYHCPELRWGASHPAELSTCAADDLKMKFYDAEQALRNKLTRDWSATADLNFDELMSGRWGTNEASLIDVRKDLESLPVKGAGQ